MKKLPVALQECWTLLKESWVILSIILKTRGKNLLSVQVKNWALFQVVVIGSYVHSQNVGSCSSACAQNWDLVTLMEEKVLRMPEVYFQIQSPLCLYYYSHVSQYKILSVSKAGICFGFGHPIHLGNWTMPWCNYTQYNECQNLYIQTSYINSIKKQQSS